MKRRILSAMLSLVVVRTLATGQEAPVPTEHELWLALSVATATLPFPAVIDTVVRWLPNPSLMERWQLQPQHPLPVPPLVDLPRATVIGGWARAAAGNSALNRLVGAVAGRVPEPDTVAIRVFVLETSCETLDLMVQVDIGVVVSQTAVRVRPTFVPFLWHRSPLFGRRP